LDQSCKAKFTAFHEGQSDRYPEIRATDMSETIEL